MATAVASTTEKIKDLLGKADEIQAGITAQEAELAKVMAQIRDTADAGSGDYQINTTPATKPAQATTTAPPPKQQPARKKKAAPKATTGNGRRKKATTKAKATKKAAGKKKGPVPATKRNYDNEMSLREAIWDVLDRPPAKWRKAIPDLPKDAIGLRAVDIVKVIEAEGKWTSASSNIGPQVAQHIKKFREEGKVARGDGKRLYIVEGAEIDGPALDEEGNPVE